MGPMTGGILAAKIYKDNFMASKLSPPVAADYRRVTSEISSQSEGPISKSRDLGVNGSKAYLDDVDYCGDDTRATNTLERTTTI